MRDRIFEMSDYHNSAKKPEWKTHSPEERWGWHNPVGANSCIGVAGGVAAVRIYLKVKVKPIGSCFKTCTIELWSTLEVWRARKKRKSATLAS